MSKTEIPSIRFRGFDDAWEQRKLGEVATFINGRAYSQPELLSSGKYKVLRVGNFYTNDSWYYSDLELGEKYYADYGDLLYTWSATFGPHIWLGDRAIYHYHIWKINLSDQLEKQFAVQLLEQDRANILSSKNGSTMVHITKEGMEQKDVIISPNTKEQQEIGAFFLQLDNLITLHQRKFEKLTNVKKSMLEKMFPRNGSCYPEIRFKGFTDPWEQRKFGEVFMSLQNNTLSRAELNDEFGAAQNIHYGDVLIKYDEILDVSKEPLSYIEKQSIADKFKTSYLQNGDVIIADTAEDETVGKCTEIEGLTDQKVISGLHTMPVRPNRKFASGFLGFYLNSAAYHDQLKPLMQGIKVTSISKGAMQDTVVKFPLDLKEQEQIGIYFGGLDHLITLHQRELEKLQNIKKSLLEKMFV